MPNPYVFSSGFPKDFQVVDGAGQLMPAWQYFLYALWSKTGGAASTITNTFTIIQQPGSTQPIIIDHEGNPVDAGSFSPPPKEAAVPVALTTSPYVFHAIATGLLMCFGGQIDYSRDGTTYYPVTMVGGQIFVIRGDYVRISWSGIRPPVVTWFAGGIVP